MLSVKLQQDSDLKAQRPRNHREPSWLLSSQHKLRQASGLLGTDSLRFSDVSRQSYSQELLEESIANLVPYKVNKLFWISRNTELLASRQCLRTERMERKFREIFLEKRIDISRGSGRAHDCLSERLKRGYPELKTALYTNDNSIDKVTRISWWCINNGEFLLQCCFEGTKCNTSDERKWNEEFKLRPWKKYHMLYKPQFCQSVHSQH